MLAPRLNTRQAGVDQTTLWDVEVDGAGVMVVLAPSPERALELAAEAFGLRPFAEPGWARPHGRVIARG